jgi:6-phosphogluconolactonase (cycloisomerase 2 family)
MAKGHVVVAEGRNGAALAGSLSSYGTSPDGTLTPISSRVGTHQTAPCWVVATDDAKFVFTANGHRPGVQLQSGHKW